MTDRQTVRDREAENQGGGDRKRDRVEKIKINKQTKKIELKLSETTALCSVK